jgi:hypothetical protein
MAKKPKVSVDDFSFFEEDELQPLNIIAKTIKRADDQIKPEPIISQSGAKVKPKPEPLHEPIMSQKSLGSENHEPQPEPLHEPIMSQSGANHEPNNDFDSLVGLQKNVLIYIFNSCINAGNKISSAITTSNISISLRSTVAAIRKAVQRLESKGFIKRYQFKDGRGGWTKYELPTLVYSNLLARQSRANHEPIMSQSGANHKPQPEPQPEPRVPCSSSNLNIKELTTTADPDLWLSVPKNLIGLVHVKQLREFIRQGLVTEDVMQTTLDGFAYDLEGGVIKAKTGNPIAILIGAIKQGGYVSQKYLEELKAQLAEVEKTRSEMQKIQAQSVTEQLKEEFETFRQSHPELAEKFKPSEKFFKAFEPGSIGYKLWIDEYKTQKDLVLLRDEPEPKL